MRTEHSDALATSLRNSARDLVAHRSLDDVDHTLGLIVLAAVDTVPGVDAGGVTMTEAGNITSRQPSNDDVRKLDALQAELHEGPCVTAAEQPPADGVVLAHDLAAPPDADRWPRFAPRAVDLGYRSLVSTHLSVDDGFRAALNLFSRAPDTFDDSARTVAGLFGVQAAVLLYGAEHAEHMQRALGTRDVIGQAKGILMERFKVDADGAFQMLVRSSQHTNLKVIDVARWLTSAAGCRPDEPTRHPR